MLVISCEFIRVKTIEALQMLWSNRSASSNSKDQVSSWEISTQTASLEKAQFESLSNDDEQELDFVLMENKVKLYSNNAFRPIY